MTHGGLLLLVRGEDGKKEMGTQAVERVEMMVQRFLKTTNLTLGLPAARAFLVGMKTFGRLLAGASRARVLVCLGRQKGKRVNRKGVCEHGGIRRGKGG